MFMKKGIAFFFFVVPLLFLSQKIDKQNARFTLRGNVGIPRVISSAMYRTAFSGLYEGNISFNMRVSGNFFAGLGYDNSHFQNDKDIFRFRYFNVTIPYNTRLNHHAGFLKLGYDKFFSQTGYVSYALNSGLMFSEYLNVNEDTSRANRPYGPKRFTAPYIQPEFSANFIVNEKQNLAFSFMIAYTTQFANFDPKAPRFNQFEEVSQKRNSYLMSWLTVGFSFHILFKEKSAAGGS
jgi:hypothetical protein